MLGPPPCWTWGCSGVARLKRRREGASGGGRCTPFCHCCRQRLDLHLLTAASGCRTAAREVTGAAALCLGDWARKGTSVLTEAPHVPLPAVAIGAATAALAVSSPP